MESKKQKQSTCNNLVFIKTLGAGYNAKVKLAYDKTSGEEVAVKIIKKINRSNLTTLQNELNIMQKLKHPNITQLVDVQQNQTYQKKNGQSKKVTFIVLELAAGGELFDYVANTGPFSHQVARSYFSQLLSALECAHHKHIAHRDLKPENLLFDGQFVLKVADWGFGAIMNGTKNETQLGTESYMAPEINNRDKYNANEVDLFAAGIVLFIMVLGTPPFTKAVKSDPYYNLLIQTKNTEKFWQQHMRFKKDKSIFTPEFKDLTTAMLQYNPKHRLTLEQVKSHPWMQGKKLDQSQLTLEFKKKKIVVDQLIEVERQKKQLLKQKKDHGPTGPSGFRSDTGPQQQQFDMLETLFDFSVPRDLPLIDHQHKPSHSINAIYTCLEPELLYKYIILAIIQENIPATNIRLNSNSKYKLDFVIQDEDEHIEVDAQITRFDESVNQVSFTRKSGNIITYYNYVKNIKDQLNSIKEKL